MSRVLYLDGWRAWAIIMVLVGHFTVIKEISFGRFGVELFFVLSGRLMAEILFVRNTPLSSFFPRRFSRVYPALLALTTILFAASYWTGGDPTASQYFAAITFTSNYAHAWTGRSAVLDHIWSLCVEEHMYILLGIIAFIHRRRPLPLVVVCGILALIAIASGFIQSALGLGYNAVYWRTDVRGASILIGVVAYLMLRDRPFPVIPPAWATVIFTLAALAFNLTFVPNPIKYSAGTVCLAIALMSIPHAKGVTKFLENPLFLRVGILSYSLYLWQQPFYHMSREASFPVLYLIACLPVALASYYFVEQPARNFLNRLGSPKPSPVAV